jgi:hypothetical protein
MEVETYSGLNTPVCSPLGNGLDAEALTDANVLQVTLAPFG